MFCVKFNKLDLLFQTLPREWQVDINWFRPLLIFFILQLMEDNNQISLIAELDALLEEIKQIHFNSDKHEKELLASYKNAVEDLCQSESDYEFKNSSPQHASIVLSTMIKHSTHEILIYDQDLSGDIALNSNDFFMSILDKAREGLIFKIVIDTIDEKDGFTNKFFKLLNKIFPKNVYIKISNDKFKDIIYKANNNKLLNFAVSDSKSYRIEEIDNGLDFTNRKASCCFNNPKFAKILKSVFDEQFSSCSPAF